MTNPEQIFTTAVGVGHGRGVGGAGDNWMKSVWEASRGKSRVLIHTGCGSCSSNIRDEPDGFLITFVFQPTRLIGPR